MASTALKDLDLRKDNITGIQTAATCTITAPAHCPTNLPPFLRCKRKGEQSEKQKLCIRKKD
jgi:hypothetical protein